MSTVMQELEAVDSTKKMFNPRSNRNHSVPQKISNRLICSLDQSICTVLVGLPHCNTVGQSDVSLVRKDEFLRKMRNGSLLFAVDTKCVLFEDLGIVIIGEEWASPIYWDALKSDVNFKFTALVADLHV